ncbi:uncharacterized protein N7477_004665 [Penicillium maclennaniae]|uniref:uncharacterized protein n=1 Tax=Penicillium maclennaniae TaxID=1343394 RepID=UPI00253FEB76|nr:uncharacterized protein N7477_004665 [Penicillium maclennaniae]KAJ5674731.1 hypothetical protein N7477_004665 [Penicillium maclennaniae]
MAPSRGEPTDLQSPPYGPFDLDFGLSTTYDIGLDDNEIDLTAFLATTPATITPPEETDTRPAFILEPHSNSMDSCTSTAVAGSAPKKNNISPCDCMQKVFPFLERVQKLAEESDSGSQDATTPRPNLMDARELTRMIRSLKDSVLQLRQFFQCTQCSSSASFMTVLILLAGHIVTTLWAAAKSSSPQSYSTPLTPGTSASSMTGIAITNCVEDMRTKRLAAFPVRHLPDSGEYHLDTEEEHYAIISTLAKVQLRRLLITLTEMKARASNADWNQQFRSVRALEERVRKVALGWADGAKIRGW